MSQKKSLLNYTKMPLNNLEVWFMIIGYWT